MNIIAVDDEELALKNLERHVKKCRPDADLFLFDSEYEALHWLEFHTAGVALLDIHIGSMGGIQLALEIRKLCPSCAIIFVTGYSEYAVKAFSIKASGYLMKPITDEELQRELDYALQGGTQGTGANANSTDKKLVVQCFGNFEVFHENKPVHFPRQKSKELFAYLVDRRGTQVTMPEIASVLWEDGKYDLSRNNQIHTFIHDLSKALDPITEEKILIKHRNAVAINTELIRCDYYDFLKGDTAAINTYTGEYMRQYWWAEFTTGKIGK